MTYCQKIKNIKQNHEIWTFWEIITALGTYINESKYQMYFENICIDRYTWLLGQALPIDNWLMKIVWVSTAMIWFRKTHLPIIFLWDFYRLMGKPVYTWDQNMPIRLRGKIITKVKTKLCFKLHWCFLLESFAWSREKG